MSFATPVNDDALKHIVNAFLDELIKKFEKTNPELIGQINKDRENIVNFLVDSLKTNGSKITPGNLKDADFVKNMTLFLTTALQCKTKLDSNKKLLDELKSLCENKDINELMEKLKSDPKALEKLFGSDRIRQILMKECASILKNESEKLDPSKSTKDNKNTLEADPMIQNLLGLLTTETGSIAVVVQVFMGNGLGIQDFNPNDGNAHIDDINKVTTVFGDSLGIEAKTKQNYDSIAGSLTEIADAIQDPINTYLARPRYDR